MRRGSGGLDGEGGDWVVGIVRAYRLVENIECFLKVLYRNTSMLVIQHSCN